MIGAVVPAADWVALSPVVVTAAAMIVVLLVDAVVGHRVRAGSRAARRLLDAIALLGLGGAGAAVAWLAASAARQQGAGRSTRCVPGAGELQLRSCSFVVSPLTLTVQALVLAAAAVCLLLALDGSGAADRTPHHVLLLAAVTGAVALAGARDLVSLVVAYETAALPVVALVALRRDARGGQAAVTLLLTAISSLGLLLLGAALLLLATGTLYLDRLAEVLADPGLGAPVRAVAALGALLAVAGIAFKLSLVPFHLWTPDTYAGAPLPVAAFLAVVSKVAALVALVVLLAIGLAPLVSVWAPIIGVLAVLSMTVGNLVALRQQVAVRLLAWSTVAQAGWVLLPLAGAQASTRQAVAASLGYLVAYSAASLAVFGVVVLVSQHHPAGERHGLDAYRGLARREPVAVAVLGLALACLAGLPPGVMGLVAKIVAVRPVVDAGHWPLAVAAAVNVALGLAYYLKWAALVVAVPAPGAPQVPTWRVTPAQGLALGASAAACLALSVAPQFIAGLLPGLLS